MAEQENHSWGVAQAHGKLALAHAWLGDCTPARRALRLALAGAGELGQNDLLLLSLLAEALCLQRAGQFEAAVRLAAFIAQHPVSWNETKAQARALQAAAALPLSAAQAQAAEQSARALDLEGLVRDLLAPAAPSIASRPLRI